MALPAAAAARSSSDYACGIPEIEQQLGEAQAQWFWQQSLDAVEFGQTHACANTISNATGHAAMPHRGHPPQTFRCPEMQWQQHAQQRLRCPFIELWDANRLTTPGQRTLPGALLPPFIRPPASAQLHAGALPVPLGCPAHTSTSKPRLCA